MKKLSRSKKNKSLLSLATLLSLAIGTNYVCTSDFAASVVTPSTSSSRVAENATNAYHNAILAISKYTPEQKIASKNYLKAYTHLNNLNKEMDKANKSENFELVETISKQIDAYDNDTFKQAEENAMKMGVLQNFESIHNAQKAMNDASKESNFKELFLGDAENTLLKHQEANDHRNDYNDLNDQDKIDFQTKENYDADSYRRVINATKARDNAQKEHDDAILAENAATANHDAILTAYNTAVEHSQATPVNSGRP